MLAHQARIVLRDERRQPDAGHHALFVDLLHDGFQAVRELYGIDIQPVAHERLEAVVDLEQVEAAVRVLQGVEDQLFVDILIY